MTYLIGALLGAANMAFTYSGPKPLTALIVSVIVGALVCKLVDMTLHPARPGKQKDKFTPSKPTLGKTWDEHWAETDYRVNYRNTTPMLDGKWNVRAWIGQQLLIRHPSGVESSYPLPTGGPLKSSHELDEMAMRLEAALRWLENPDMI